MSSWMWTGWSSTAAGPAPEGLTAVTRRKNLSPRARFRTVCWVTITGRGFTGTHSEAEGSGKSVWVLVVWQGHPSHGAPLLKGDGQKLTSLLGCSLSCPLP